MTANINNPAFVIQGPTVNVAASATSAATRVRAAAVSGAARHVRVWNSSTTVAVFLENGTTSTVTASTTASIPIPPAGTSGLTQVLTLQGDYVAAVVSGTTAATVYFTPGEGL